MRRKEQSAEVSREEVPGSPKRYDRYKEVKWDKLDNAAHLFPAIAGEEMTNVYRLSVVLKELVVPELLQQALEMLLPKIPGFHLRVRHGVFWYYFEENEKPVPLVREEFNYPCRFIRGHQNNDYMFRVTYYRYRINLEIFHVLTDGMGGFNFLKELTYQYLRLRHPELMAQNGNALHSGTSLNREDGFVENFRKTSSTQYKSQEAYRITGERLADGEFGVMHGFLNLSELKKVSRGYGVSINEYLVACYTWSVYTECLRRLPSQVPIRVAVPVNLRPYFDSNTTKNFFSMVSAEFHPVKDCYAFDEVVEEVKKSLRSQMTREHLEKVFSYSVSSQKNPILRMIPLPLKGFAMRHVYNRSALANTTTITNVGNVVVAEEYRPYVDLFFAILPISKGQNVKGTVCSYGDTLVFTFSYNMAEPAVQRRFFRTLSQDGLQVKIESNGVHYG